MADPQAPTLGGELRSATERLRRSGKPTPELDARLLLGEVLSLDRAGLMSREELPLAQSQARRLEELLARRLAGEPVHRILGRRGFYAHEFVLTPQTLEPRPDTEALVDLAAKAIEASFRERGECRFADIGTGSGAIAVSLLALFPESSAILTDISVEAVRTALQNARSAGVERRCHGVVGDYLGALAGPLDVVVSNPPYIPHEVIETLAPEVRLHDPRRALDGGADGLDAYRAMAAEAARVLRPGGSVLVEFGAGQENDVAALFAGAGFEEVGSAQDLSGTLRAMWFRMKAEA